MEIKNTNPEDCTQQPAAVPEIVGTMVIGKDLCVAYDVYGEPVYLKDGWEFKDGSLVQKEAL